MARKTSVCCSSSLFILDDSSLVRWKEWICSFAGVCRTAASDTAPATLLGTSHCPVSVDIVPSLCRACRRRTNLNSPCSVGHSSPSVGKNSQEGRDKQHKETLHTGTSISAACPGLGWDACLLATKVS